VFGENKKTPPPPRKRAPDASDSLRQSNLKTSICIPM
jgi:hypothetical protein